MLYLALVRWEATVAHMEGGRADAWACGGVGVWGCVGGCLFVCLSCLLLCLDLLWSTKREVRKGDAY